MTIKRGLSNIHKMILIVMNIFYKKQRQILPIIEITNIFLKWNLYKSSSVKVFPKISLIMRVYPLKYWKKMLSQNLNNMSL